MTYDSQATLPKMSSAARRTAALLFGLSLTWLTTLALAQSPNAPQPSTNATEEVKGASEAKGATDEAKAEGAEADMRLVEPFVGEATFLVLKVDPRQLVAPRPPDGFETATPQAKATFAEFTRQFTTGLQELKLLADGHSLFATADVPRSKTHMPLTGFRRKTTEEDAEKVIARLRDEFRLVAGREGEYLVATPSGAARHSQATAPPATRQAFAAAFGSVHEFPVQLLLVPPEHLLRTMRELSPELPRSLGGGPSRVLTDGVRWVGIGIDPQRLLVAIHIQSTDEQAAREFAEYLPTLLRLAYRAVESIPSETSRKVSELLLTLLKPQVDGDRVTLRIDGFEQTSANLAVLAAILGALEDGARHREHTQSFKQILLAMHNYYDTHKTFPPADKHRGDDGEHRLSWRVHLLPFLGEVELYQQFRLDEAWDSAHNKPLLEKMPKVYDAQFEIGAAKVKLKPGHTTFLAPVGKGTIFGGERATTFPQIKDGTSNTIALVEVAAEHSVPWTAPRGDYAFDPENPLDGIVTRDGKWLAAFADGSVRQLSKDLARQTVLHLFQMNDGNPVDIR